MGLVRGSGPHSFFLGGASGAGKTTIGLMVAEQVEGLAFVRRCTTRERRGTTDDREYTFVSPGEFDSIARSGGFLEYRHYEFGMAYGLRRSDIEDVLGTGADSIAIMNLSRSEELSRSWPGAVTIFLDVSIEELEARLRARGANTPEQIAERLGNARAAMLSASTYDFVVPNNARVQDAADRVAEIIESVRNRKPIR